MPDALSTWRTRLGPGALVRGLLARRGSIEAPLGRAWQGDLAAIRAVRRQVPLLMCDAAALQIMLCVRAAARLGGAMAEAGVMMGGSARLICEAKGAAQLHLFDAFETQQSGEADPAGTEVRDHFGTTHGVRANVERLLQGYPGVVLHPGIFPKTADAVDRERFSFVHLDMDLVSSTDAALAFFHPRLVPGGILIGDDYEDFGVRGCFERYLGGRRDTMLELPWGQVMIVRQGEPS